MRRPRLVPPATWSLVALALATATGCAEDDPPPVMSCPAAGLTDQTTLDRWLAQPLKTCALAAVFPHRTRDVVTTLADGGNSGWDAERVLDGADANGVRAFDADGLEFAAFGDFTAMPDEWARREALVPDDACGADDPAVLRARVELVDGTCVLELGGVVVFAQPLHPTMTVTAASWPDIAIDRWPATEPPAPTYLRDGYVYAGAPAMPALDAFMNDRRAAAVVADWLGVEPAPAARGLRFDFSMEHLLVTTPDLDLPPFLWGDNERTVLTLAEDRALRDAPLHLVWHFSGPLAKPTAWDSTIEVTPTALRYTGGQPRDTDAATHAAATCVKDVIDRRLAARVELRTWSTPPIGRDWLTCGRFTTDLPRALALDAPALATVLDLYGDVARARYGGPRADAAGYDYYVHDPELAATVAHALVDDAAGLRGRAPSLTLDHALASWDALRAAGVVPRDRALALRLAAATLARANIQTPAPITLAPLTPTDTAAIVRAMAAAPHPLTAAFRDELVRQISTWAAPADHP